MSSFGQDLSKYKWEKRIILVTAHEDDLWQDQKKIIEECALQALERKLIVLRNTQSNKKGTSVKLIGLDGGVKYESDKPMSCSTIFTLIDAMPMRRQEIKTHKK